MEIADTPEDLGMAVALVGEREDHVIVGLGDSRTMAGEAGLALGIGVEDGLIDGGRIVLKPGEEGRAEVKADACIVVDDLGDAIVAVEHAGKGVGRVAFGGDPFVPIMIRIGGVLKFDCLEPGILSRWLVKMTVDTDVFTHRKRVRAEAL